MVVNGGPGVNAISLAGVITAQFANVATTTVDAGDLNDTITGSERDDTMVWNPGDDDDVNEGGAGNDLIVARDEAADAVECGAGLDLGLVDELDTVRGCDLVLGGLLRVHVLGKVALEGNTAVLRLRCVDSTSCKSKVRLRRAGKTLGKEKATLSRGSAKTVRVVLNARGRRLLAGSGNGLRVKLQVDSRDKAGNGWRVTKKATLAP